MDMVRRVLLAAAFFMGLVPMVFAQLSSHDKTFVLDAAEINNYEIQAALLADKYSNNPLYRTYAMAIANNQTEQSGELESTVATADPSMRLPTGVSPSGQRMLNALKNSRNVDATFRSQIIASKLATLKMYQSYIGQPDVNSEIKKMAEGLMMTFEQQLEDARNLPPPNA
jgi:predicted outer membrane protein